MVRLDIAVRRKRDIDRVAAGGGVRGQRKGGAVELALRGLNVMVELPSPVPANTGAMDDRTARGARCRRASKARCRRCTNATVARVDGLRNQVHRLGDTIDYRRPDDAGLRRIAAVAVIGGNCIALAAGHERDGPEIAAGRVVAVGIERVNRGVGGRRVNHVVDGTVGHAEAADIERLGRKGSCPRGS